VKLQKKCVSFYYCFRCWHCCYW